MQRHALVTVAVVILGVGGPSFTQCAAQLHEDTKVVTLEISDQQRALLVGKSWKIEVRSSSFLSDADLKAKVPIQRECETILERSGCQVDAEEGSVLLQIQPSGEALSSSYYGTPSRRYSGARLRIRATVKTTNEPAKTVLSFSDVPGEVPTPYTIGGGYQTPADAPFDRAYASCRQDVHTQLISIIHAIQGAKATYNCIGADERSIRDSTFAFIRASGDSAFVPLLITDLMVSDTRGLGIVAECLGDLADTRAVEPLCASLVDEKGQIVASVASALGRIGDAEAIPHLRGAMLEVGPNADVAHALEALEWRASTAREKVMYSIALDRPEDVRRMKGEASPTLVALLEDGEGESQEIAARLLGELKEHLAIDPLTEALLISSDYELRLAAAEALSEIGTERVVEPLATAMISDSWLGVRLACVAGLEKAGGGGSAVQFLVQAASSDKEEKLVIAAEGALGRLQNAVGADCLIKNLSHKSADVRRHAVMALKQIGGAKAVEGIRSGLGAETETRVLQEMIRALAALGIEDKSLAHPYRLRLLAERKQWEEIRNLLKEQSTEDVIEALNVPAPLVIKIARFILVQRTGKYDLQDYEGWKQWWAEENKELSEEDGP